MIDLRECISLELGLEYKNLQHILSLGTFKRTFFLGAPSDALMLQWGNVLEKVKNAGDGMFTVTHLLSICNSSCIGYVYVGISKWFYSEYIASRKGVHHVSIH